MTKGLNMSGSLIALDGKGFNKDLLRSRFLGTLDGEGYSKGFGNISCRRRSRFCFNYAELLIILISSTVICI